MACVLESAGDAQASTPGGKVMQLVSMPFAPQPPNRAPRPLRRWVAHSSQDCPHRGEHARPTEVAILAGPVARGVASCFPAASALAQQALVPGGPPQSLQASILENAMRRKADMDSALKAFYGQFGIGSSELTLSGSIGSGSTAQVFRGRWNEQDVAVKRIGDMDETTTTSIVRELGVLARTKHPNLVCLLGFCFDSEQFTFDFVLELCRGGTLFSLLHLSEQEVCFMQQLKLAQDIALGMAYLHGLDPPVLHRDLKSLNVLLCEPLVSTQDVPFAKITDFGAAKMNMRRQKPLPGRRYSGRRRRGLRDLKPGRLGRRPESKLHRLLAQRGGAVEQGEAPLLDLPECRSRHIGFAATVDLPAMTFRDSDSEKHAISEGGSHCDEKHGKGRYESAAESNSSESMVHSLTRHRAYMSLDCPVGLVSEASQACSFYPSSAGTASSSLSMTMTMRVGTLQWMSPEMLSPSGSNYTPQVDVYSYGMLLFEIMCFEPPFCELETEELETFILGGGRPEVDWAAMPDEFARLTQACWAQEAIQRPNFSMVVRALGAIY